MHMWVEVLLLRPRILLLIVQIVARFEHVYQPRRHQSMGLKLHHFERQLQLVLLDGYHLLPEEGQPDPQYRSGLNPVLQVGHRLDPHRKAYQGELSKAADLSFHSAEGLPSPVYNSPTQARYGVNKKKERDYKTHTESILIGVSMMISNNFLLPVFASIATSSPLSTLKYIFNICRTVMYDNACLWDK